MEPRVELWVEPAEHAEAPGVRCPDSGARPAPQTLAPRGDRSQVTLCWVSCPHALKAPHCQLHWCCRHSTSAPSVNALLLTLTLPHCSMGGGVAALLTLRLRYMFPGAAWHSSPTYCCGTRCGSQPAAGAQHVCKPCNAVWPTHLGVPPGGQRGLLLRVPGAQAVSAALHGLEQRLHCCCRECVLTEKASLLLLADVHCWAFCPLGASVSANVSAAMEPYCTSIIVGKVSSVAVKESSWNHCCEP